MATLAEEIAEVEETLAAARTRLKAAMATEGSPGYNPNAPGNVDHSGEVDKLLKVIEHCKKELSRLDVFEHTSEMSA